MNATASDNTAPTAVRARSIIPPRTAPCVALKRGHPTRVMSPWTAAQFSTAGPVTWVKPRRCVAPTRR